MTYPTYKAALLAALLAGDWYCKHHIIIRATKEGIPCGYMHRFKSQK